MAHPDLLAHRAQFEKSITRLGDGIYTAVGYAASNVHMIEGDSSITIIDTSESTRPPKIYWPSFKNCRTNPLRGSSTPIHRDPFLAHGFAQGGICPFGPSRVKSILWPVDKIPAPNMALGRRTQAQFGIELVEKSVSRLAVGRGIARCRLGAGFLPPTQ